MPKRIQRKRTKGWKMPEGAVYVGRPTKWGNPFRVGRPVDRGPNHGGYDFIKDRADAVALFRLTVGPITGGIEARDFIKAAQCELRGKDLACWCPLDQPCHADVLLEIANAAA